MIFITHVHTKHHQNCYTWILPSIVDWVIFHSFIYSDSEFLNKFFLLGSSFCFCFVSSFCSKAIYQKSYIIVYSLFFVVFFYHFFLHQINVDNRLPYDECENSMHKFFLYFSLPGMLVWVRWEINVKNLNNQKC